eukprot:GEMP01058362.1.p1 GENE.GEMP01058362.1~~GEMP01058362.1.p1  ORF type:complete len:323 (+),score=63.72 GEMP01058362.1:67-1035(+)
MTIKATVPSAPSKCSVNRHVSDLGGYSLQRTGKKPFWSSSDSDCSDDSSEGVPRGSVATENDTPRKEIIFAIKKHGSLTFVSEHEQKAEQKRRRQRALSDSFPRMLAPPKEIMWTFTYDEGTNLDVGPSVGAIEQDDAKSKALSYTDYLERRQIMEGVYTAEMIHLTDDVDECDRTTVMMRNLPNKYNRDTILQLINKHQYADTFDFFYLPIDFRSKSNMGYAFINFIDPTDARRFKDYFTGFNSWNFNSVKNCEVSWSKPFQGLAAHVDRYRNSPMMHESVPFEYRPCLFKNGDLLPFPKPLKTIEPPKIRRAAKGDKNPS